MKENWNKLSLQKLQHFYKPCLCIFLDNIELYFEDNKSISDTKLSVKIHTLKKFGIYISRKLCYYKRPTLFNIQTNNVKHTHTLS